MIYDVSSRVFLACNKFIAWLLNTSSNWEFSIQYTLSFDGKKALNEATNAILDNLPQTKLWQDSETQKIIQSPGFTTRIKLLEETSEDGNIGTFINVDLTDMNVSYRYTKEMLARKIAPLLEKLSIVVRNETIKYTFRIKYDGKNPFFGLYIKRLSPNEIASFKCELFEVIGNEKDFISIQKETTTIITSSVFSLLTLSQKYLSYSSTSSS